MPRHPTDRASLEADCDETFLKGTGPGGQHRNKRETGVRLVHRPTGVVVMATERRSQARNRDLAFERMAERLAALNRVRKRRVATKVPRGAIKRRLTRKRQRSETKKLRGKVRRDD